MKKLLALLPVLVLVSCFKLPAYRHVEEDPKLDLVSSGRFPVYDCYTTDMGLEVKRVLPPRLGVSTCPDFRKLNRVTKDFCWEYHTKGLRAKPTPCLKGKTLIITERLQRCSARTADIIDSRCIFSNGATVTWLRKSLIAGPEPHQGLGWRYDTWHLLCHMKNPNDFLHEANCYGAPLATDKIFEEDPAWPY